MNESFENQHKEEYFQIINQQLAILIGNLETHPLEDRDYIDLSRRATCEVAQYIKDWLLKPLIEIEGGSEKVTEVVLESAPPQKFIGNQMQKIALFSNPLQELFAALKEVQHFDPSKYEQLIRDYPNIVQVLTDLINKLESARK